MILRYGTAEKVDDITDGITLCHCSSSIMSRKRIDLSVVNGSPSKQPRVGIHGQYVPIREFVCPVLCALYNRASCVEDKSKQFLKLLLLLKGNVLLW